MLLLVTVALYFLKFFLHKGSSTSKSLVRKAIKEIRISMTKKTILFMCFLSVGFFQGIYFYFANWF